ncbi:MAG: YdcF family protein [Deltaproteobacteria bacterium]|nr:YdcF family protein [Deltaproteobacteria bacterium]MCH7915156.1 YdcF family protein [Deltaproteobacteria bacterium]
MKAKNKPASFRSKLLQLVIIVLVAALLLYFLSGPIMIMVGEFLVQADEPARSDAVVVLSTGIEYYPRLMEAAMLFQDGFAERVAINGNRKSEALRELERRGFQSCCLWYEDALRVLELLGVQKERVIIINAESAYDTVSEAKLVGEVLSEAGITSIILTTSKYHTRRARYIWKKLFPDRFTIRAVAARNDPFSPEAWWKEGRQVRWVLAEYGAWIYYFWKTGWSKVR